MFNLKPSILLKRSFICVVVCSMIFMWLLPKLIMIKVIASLITLGISYFVYQQKCLKPGFEHIKYLDKEHWLLQSATGHSFQGKLQGDSVVNSIFSILILKSTTAKQTKKLLIFRDMLPKMQYHQLQLYLKGYLS